MSIRRSQHSVALFGLSLSLSVPLFAASAHADGPAPLPPPPAYSDPSQPGAQPSQPYYQPPQDMQPQPYGQPQPVYVQPYGQPQPYAQPQPYVQPPQPVYAPPQPVYAPPQRRFTYTSGFRPQFGMAFRASGLYVDSAALGYSSGGVGLELLFRVHRRITLELSAQYQHISENDYNYAYGYDRYDAPFIGGMRIHLGNPFWFVSPYLVGALGATYSRMYIDNFTEAGWFGEFQGGAGVELRGGRHFTLNLDLRGIGRLRSNDKNEVFLTDDFGRQAPALGNQGGIVFNFGIGGFF